MKYIQAIFLLSVGIFLTAFSGCNETNPQPEPEVKEYFEITINHLYNGEPLVYNTIYQSAQGNDLWITLKEYYLSNIIAIKPNGTKELISDIVLVEQNTGSSTFSFSGSIPKGDYTGVSFDLGVREDLNSKDPASYANDHPLSVINNMYWGWSTQYIFSKIEGFEVSNNDTVSFVIHTGTQDLYRPGIIINKSFTVPVGGSSLGLDLDIYTIFKGADYTFDLIENGQSHTDDNVELAAQYMDNFSKAFK